MSDGWPFTDPENVAVFTLKRITRGESPILRVCHDEDDEGPAFAYSIGLFKSFGHPEVIVFGLDVDLMHRMINLIGEEVRQGRRFADGDSASGILEGYDVRFLNVASRHYYEHFGYARWFYNGDDFPVLQCHWPDKKGRFPTDPGFAKALRSRQPLLDL
jgi:hypothetical protein